MPAFETDRLVLRRVRSDSDLAALFYLFAVPEVARFIDTGPFTSMSEATDVMDWIGDIFNRRRGMRWL